MNMNKVLSDKEEMYQVISDISKDIQGYRVRYSIQDMTLEEVRELFDYWILRNKQEFGE